jgi:hypothetical protein
MRVAYLCLMGDQPGAVRAVAPAHAAYWRGLALPGYLGGPFDDRSGGLITFDTESIENAEDLVAEDSLVREGLADESMAEDVAGRVGTPAPAVQPATRLGRPSPDRAGWRHLHGATPGDLGDQRILDTSGAGSACRAFRVRWSAGPLVGSFRSRSVRRRRRGRRAG